MAERILMVAGDPSGDHQAARLAVELRRRRPGVELYGCGGPQMAAAGVRVTGDLVSLSAIGAADALPSLVKGRRLLRELIAAATATPPTAAVLVDCGAFNLPLARALKPLGVPVLGYFPPGSWSGSRKRARSVAEAYTTVATPFPQPMAAYAELGLPAQMVGHPLVEELAPVVAERAAAPLDPPVLALLPGSRRQEIRHILAPMLGAAARLQAELPDLRVIVSRAASAPADLFERVAARSSARFEVVEGSLDALRPATAALVKSGTITLEATLLGVPQVVVYRGSHLAYLVASVYYWPRPKYWAMPNILAQDLVVPQLFQYRVHPQRLAAEVRPLLSDTPQRRTMVARLTETAARLAGGDTVERVADMLLALLG